MRVLTLLFGAALLAAQVPTPAPKEDRRNTNTPDTDTHATLPSFHSLQDWEKRKVQLRKQILSAAGLYPMPERSPLHAQVFGRLQREDYSIEKVLLETLPGYYLGGNLYRPLNRTGKRPAIVNPHGHWTYGRLENQDSFSAQALGINLAKQGYVVFAYDMVGYNDTIQTPHNFGTPAEQLWSFGPMQLQLWNSIRATDFVSGLPDVDAARLAVTGASGGGTQAFLLAAVDDRIGFAAPVNMVSALMQGGDFCENAPGLRVGTNNVEIAAMFAPKPMLLVSATGDWTKNVPREEFPAIRSIYQLYGKPENVEVIQIDAPHNFNQRSREGVYRFFANRMLGQTNSAPEPEKEVEVEMLQDMLALAGRTLPERAASYQGVFEQWKTLNSVQSSTKERLQLALGVTWPEKVASHLDGDAIVLSRPSVGDRIPAILIAGQGPATLVVHPKGAAAAMQTPEVAALVKQQRLVLLIDAFQTAGAIAPRNRSHKHFLTFNLSDDACRVQDILTALAFLQQSSSKPVELIGLGDAAVWSYFAAAVASAPINLHADIANFSGSDEDFLRVLNVPGIQRAGGLSAAKLALTVVGQAVLPAVSTPAADSFR
jgi:dienelactone hydrolase